MKTHWILIIMLLAVSLGGCSSSPTQAGDSLSVPSPTQLSPKKHPGEIQTPQVTTLMPQSIPSPLAPDLQKLIEKAKEDLANRLTISKDQISFIEIFEVTWPDSSLGCPQKGLAYAQVMTPGYLIRLASGNSQYEYHSGKGPDVIFCSNPSAQVPGIPGTY